MRYRLCQFFSSSGALLTLVGIAIAFVGPGEWWQKVIFALIFVPILVAATSKFFGVTQLWQLECGASRQRGRQDDPEGK